MPGLFSPSALQPYADHAAASMPSPAPAPDAPKGIGPWPYAAAVGGNLADILSTIAALSNGHAHEANPLLPNNSAAIAGIKGAATVPELLLMLYAARHGHPTLAKAMGYGLGATGAGLAIHNATVAR